MAEKKLVFNLSAEKDDSVSSSIREITQELTDVRKMTALTLTLDIDSSVNRTLDQISSRLDDIRAKANINVSMTESGFGGSTHTAARPKGRGARGLFGFASGGFTGYGYDDQPAGIVHANEYVFPADVVRKVGAGFFDRQLSKLRGYADGGLVESEDRFDRNAVFNDIMSYASTAAGVAGVDSMTGGHGVRAVQGVVSEARGLSAMARIGAIRQAFSGPMGYLAGGVGVEIAGRAANNAGEYMVNNYGNSMERMAMRNENAYGLHNIPVVGQAAGAVSKGVTAITTRGDMFGGDFRQANSVFDSTDGSWGGRLSQVRNIASATITGQLGWESMKYMTGGKQNLEDSEKQNASQNRRIAQQDWERRFYDREGKEFAQGSSEALHARGAMYSNERAIRGLRLGTASERAEEIASSLSRAQMNLGAADKRVESIQNNPLKQMEGATLPAAIAEQKQAEEEVLKLLKEQGSVQKEIASEKKKTIEESIKAIEHAQKQLEIESKILEKRATANQNAQERFADMDELEKANAKDAIAKLERGEKLDSTERGYVKGLVSGSPEMQAKYDEDAKQSVRDEGEKMQFLSREDSLVKTETDRVERKKAQLNSDHSEQEDKLETLATSVDEGTTKVSEAMKAIFERYSRELTEKLNAGLERASSAEDKTKQYQHRNDSTRIAQEAT